VIAVQRRGGAAISTDLEFRVLGPLEVLSGGRTVEVVGDRPRAVLGLLLLDANRRASVDVLVEGVWGPGPPATARTALRGHVSRLRRLLDLAGEGSRIETTGDGYLLRIGTGELDLAEFERLGALGCRALEAEHFGEASELLASALALWRGRPFAATAFEHFPAGEVGRLEEYRAVLLERRVEADLALGRHLELVGELQQLVSEHPFREHLHHQLMLALYRSGRPVEALEAYRAARATLVGELGLEPGAELRELEFAILAQDHKLDGPGRSVENGRTARSAGLPAGVPAPVTSLVGRERELEDLAGMIGDPDVRLVTLTGAGGVGKTRLAIAALIRASGGQDAAAVWLADVRDPELVASTIASRLGVKELPGTSLADQLAAFLSTRELLVLLDNFEHLVTGAAALPAKLLAAAPGLKLLVTSRTVLRLSGEHEFPVPPLELPPRNEISTIKESESARLFLARARAARYGFEPSQAELETIGEVCKALGGLPLAIELAAARTRLLSPQQLLLGLRQPLATLRGGPRDAPARQRTMRATLDWSHQLLDPAARELLASLGVFAGGFTLDAAIALSAPDRANGEQDPGMDSERGATVTRAMSDLLDHSLVTQRYDGRGESRFAMLEIIRHYAQDKLAHSTDPDLANETQKRHAEHYAQVCERLRSTFWGPDHAVGLETLDQELNNIRAALAWSLEHGDPQLALEILAHTRLYWLLRGHRTEARAMLERTLRSTAPMPTVPRIQALRGLIAILVDQGEQVTAREFAEQALHLARQFGDDGLTALVASESASLLVDLGQLDRASVLAEEAADLAARANQPEREVAVLSSFGEIELLRGHYGRAERALERAVAIARQLETPHACVPITSLAGVMLRTGRVDQALALLHEAGALIVSLGEEGRYASSLLVTCAALHAQRGDHELAVRLLARCDALLTNAEIELSPHELKLRDQTETDTRAGLDIGTIAAVKAEGHALTVHDAITQATRSPCKRPALALMHSAARQPG
jgi:predicted ATPase/DNA-binding SARP family transcriptional activator